VIELAQVSRRPAGP